MTVYLRVAIGLPQAGAPVLSREGDRGPLRDATGRSWPTPRGVGAELVAWILDGPRPLPDGCLTPAGAAAITPTQRAQLVAHGCVRAEPAPRAPETPAGVPSAIRARAATAPQLGLFR